MKIWPPTNFGRKPFPNFNDFALRLSNPLPSL
jgi:hypothetical protein